MDSSNEIVVYTPKPPQQPRLVVAGRKARCFAGHAQFREAPFRPAAFIVKSEDADYSGRTLREVRGDPEHAPALILVDGAVSEADRPLADGPLPKTAKALLEIIERTRGRAQSIRPKADNRSPEALLLEYLWLRPGQALEPAADWHHPRRYHYPVVSAMDPTGTDPEVWLRNLDKGGLLERVALRDRQRECDHCGSAHLSFIDVCPNCRGIDIGQHTALHCFTCGLIAPEERFVRGELRICPKCGTRLRHIGSDYDRPLETGTCGDCDHVFVEGEVMARCMICGHVAAPTALRLRPIHAWRLSPLGCLAAQGAAGSPATAASEEPGQRLAYPSFVAKLNWSLKLAAEHPSLSFHLLGLHLENAADLDEALGAGRAAALLDAFFERLHEYLAEVDFSTRADAETILLLLPNGDRQRLQALQDAIKRLTRQARQEGEAGPRWRLAEISLSPKDVAGNDATDLLERLRAVWTGAARTARVA